MSSRLFISKPPIFFDNKKARQSCFVATLPGDVGSSAIFAGWLHTP